MDAVTARTEMIQIWLADDPNASWSALADGMEYAQQNALARRIRETYNCKLDEDDAVGTCICVSSNYSPFTFSSRGSR